MFSVDRIDHVVINCRDVEMTADWYVRVLGMRRESYLEGPHRPGVRQAMTSYYCRDPDGNLIEISSYGSD